MRRYFLLFALLFSVLQMTAQYTFYVEGQQVAYGIQQKEEMPPALQELVKAHAALPLQSRRKKFSTKAVSQTTVGPLLQSIRDQEEPYNLLCPYWTYSDGSVSQNRCLSGCVATAIEQVMAYHRYPKALIDSLAGWSTPNYTLTTLLAGTCFDWDHYLLDYRQGWTPEQGLAIALPTLACGMAVHMNYGLNASGADTERAVEPLKRVFGYPMARYYNRLLYSPQRWNAMVRYELENHRPIVYTGYNMPMSGHAFNIDGIDANGFYHVNWGYNGSYDGWYHPDWLDPWEPVREDTFGIAEGFFCNHYALFMGSQATDHPLELDSFQMDSLGIICENISFCRQPDLQGHVGCDLTFYNTGADTITYTYELFTYLPTDTAIFEQANYIAVAAINLLPQQRKTQRVYVRFLKDGERILGLSHDDITIPFSTPVSIAQGTTPILSWGEVTTTYQATSVTTGNVTFSISVQNLAQSGVAGNLVTFCLYPDGNEKEDLRHYSVLSLPALQDTTLSVTFTDLQPQTSYHFLVRSPWTIQGRSDFITPTWTGIISPEISTSKAETRSSLIFDLSGRISSLPFPDIYIRNGRKLLQTH